MNTSKSIIQSFVLILLLLLSLVIFIRYVTDLNEIMLWIGFLSISFLPGWLLLRIIYHENRFSFLENIPLSICLSFALLTIPAIIIFIFQLQIVLFLFSIIFIISMLSILNIVLKQKRIIAHFSSTPPFLDSGELSIFVISLLYFVVMVRIGGELGEDTVYHLGLIHKLVVRSHASLLDFACKGAGPHFEYTCSPWLLLVASLCKVTGIDPKIFWWKVPAILTPIAIVTYYILARALFKDKLIGVVTASILVIGLGGIIYKDIGFQELNAPYGLSRYIFIPVGYFFLFRYLRFKEKKAVFITSFLSLTIASIHLFYYVLFLFSVVFFWIFYLLFKHVDKKGVKAISAQLFWILVITLPYLYLRYLPILSYGMTNPFDTDITVINSTEEGYLNGCAVFLTPSLFYINPKFVFQKIYIIWHEHTYLPIIALLFTPLLHYYHKKKYDWAIFLLSGLIMVPFLMLNPFLVPLLHKFISVEYTARTSDILPTFLILGIGIGSIVLSTAKFIQRIEINRRILTFATGGLIILTFIFHKGEIKNLIHRAILSKSSKDILSYPEAFDFLSKNVPETSVVLSDELTSTNLLPYIKGYVVPYHPGWAGVLDGDALQRVEDVKRTLDSLMDIGMVIFNLRKYNVDYILLDLKKEKEFYKRTAIKFKKYKEIFSQIYSSEQFVVFKFNKCQNGT